MKHKGSNAVKFVLATVLVVCVIFPLVKMFLNIDAESLESIVNNERFGLVVGNSIKVALVSTIISVSLALLLSFCIARSRIRGKNVFRILLTLPMLIPSISHGWGLIILFGANGIITNMLGLESNIYGFNGIVIGSVMYSFPIAFLMLMDVQSLVIREAEEVKDKRPQMVLRQTARTSLAIQWLRL